MRSWLLSNTGNFLKYAANAKAEELRKNNLEQLAGGIAEWYAHFTDIGKANSSGIKTALAASIKSKVKADMDTLVHSAVEFLFAYLEPVEKINMALYNPSQKAARGLKTTVKKMSDFHKKRLGSLGWIVKLLTKFDPLFPAESMQNKLACCLSDVKNKHCYNNAGKCFFEPSLSWIRRPSFVSSDMITDKKDDNCCLGTTLSSCSGGTLYCDCVAGNTGCDCKAPNRLCSKNDKTSISVATDSISPAGSLPTLTCPSLGCRILPYCTNYEQPCYKQAKPGACTKLCTILTACKDYCNDLSRGGRTCTKLSGPCACFGVLDPCPTEVGKPGGGSCGLLNVGCPLFDPVRNDPGLELEWANFDASSGKFVLLGNAANANIRLDLGSMIRKNADCELTGWCPPVSCGCNGSVAV